MTVRIYTMYDWPTVYCYTLCVQQMIFLHVMAEWLPNNNYHFLLKSISPAVYGCTITLLQYILYTYVLQYILNTYYSIYYTHTSIHSAMYQWVIVVWPYSCVPAPAEAEGEEFYLAFFGDYIYASTFYLYVTTAERQPVAFTVSAPGTGYSANGTAQYGEVATFAFDASEYALSNTSDRTKAIIVRTDSHCELTVYAGDLMTGAGDSLLALSKQPDLGPNNYEYIVASYSTVPNALSLSAVAIIAQYDDTQLSISPSPHNMFGNALIQPNLELQEGETFLIESSNDLTGLLVASNKPLAVLFCDPFIEQVPPVFTWGRQFATAPLKGRQAYDVFRVVASEDPTEVMVTCSSSDTADSKGVLDAYYYKLGRRAFVELNVSSNQYCFIQGSSNILVLQYSAGFHVDNTTGDPTMITVPALTQYCNHYSLPTIGPSDGSINFTHHMNIFIPTPFYQLDQIFLNNQPLSSYNLNFTVIEQDGAPRVYASQVDLTEGVHTLYHTGPAATLGVVMYGFTFSNSYGHPGGLRLAQGAVCTGHALHNALNSYMNIYST